MCQRCCFERQKKKGREREGKWGLDGEYPTHLVVFTEVAMAIFKTRADHFELEEQFSSFRG